MPGGEFTAIYTDILLLHRLCKAALTLAVSKVVRSALTKSQLCGRHDQNSLSRHVIDTSQRVGRERV